MSKTHNDRQDNLSKMSSRLNEAQTKLFKTVTLCNILMFYSESVSALL